MYLNFQTVRYVLIHILRVLLPLMMIIFVFRGGKALYTGRQRSAAGCLLLTLIQILLVFFFGLEGTGHLREIIIAFGCICFLQWFLLLPGIKGRLLAPVLQDMAFFLCSIGLACLCSIRPSEVYKQILAILLGICAYFCILRLLRRPEKARRFGMFASIFGLGLLLGTLLFGRSFYGAKNWILAGRLSLQPAELVKVCFLYMGACCLDKPMGKKGLLLFGGYTLLLCFLLIRMNDLGTALLFLATFLLLISLRSLGMAAGFSALSGFAVLAALCGDLAPNALRRLRNWGKIWSDPFGFGYQQTQALIAVASGGLFGLGPEQGVLKYVFAADSDLVFGAICEEWGVITGILCVVCVIIMGIYALRQGKNSSCFDAVLSCGGAGMLMMQMALNVFGTTDILPMTGIVFPFVSNGGSAMVASWCLLAFVQQGGEL